jgi:hypothetical protein
MQLGFTPLQVKMGDKFSNSLKTVCVWRIIAAKIHLFQRNTDKSFHMLCNLEKSRENLFAIF